MTDFNWSPGAVDELRRLAKLELPSSEIARRLSERFRQPVTRNAVIGKRNRLGDVVRAPPRATQCDKSRPPRKRVHRAKAWKPRAPTPAPAPEPIPEPIAPEAVPMAQRCTLIDLTNETCRWPIGDPGTPDFFFCGGPTANMATGQPYCSYHTRVAYQSRTTTRRPFIPMRGAAA